MEAIVKLLRQLTPDLRPGYVKEFHEQLFEAVKDGKLTEEEIKRLEAKREELGLTDEALSAVRQEMYLAAFHSVQEQEDVTDEEWDELEHIQDYLGLSDADIAKTKKELLRMRILSEIKKGNLPVISSSDIIPKSDELIHWSEPTDKGLLVITNKRIIVKGSEETLAFNLSRMVDAEPSVEGITLHVRNHKPVKVRYVLKGNHNVVGSIMLHAIAHAREAS